MVTHKSDQKKNNKTLSGCVYEPCNLFCLRCTHHLSIPLANLMRTWVRASLEHCMGHGL